MLNKEKVQEAMQGKTVKYFRDYYNRGDDYIEIGFTDGTAVRFRYDWIYEAEILEATDEQ